MTRASGLGRALGSLAATVAVTGAALTVLNALTVRRARPHAPDVPADRTISVLIPARDERARIGPCLQALRAQLGVPGLEIVVLDDGSTDGTADAARRAGDGDTRVRVLTGAELPPGWLGKPHACAQLAAAATGSLLIFLDADVVVHPRGIAAAVHVHDQSGGGLVSVLPRQVARGSAERLVQPLLAWSWLSTLPVAVAEHSFRPSTAAAIGQFLCIDRQAYRVVGGHAAVRGCVVDDVELARAAKRAGRRAQMVLGTDIACCRMYAGWGEVRAGYRKWLWAAFGPSGRPVAVAAAAAALLALGPGAAVAAVRGSRAGAVAMAAGVLGRAVAAGRTRSPIIPDALGHPLSLTLAAGLLTDSALGHHRGGLAWRGRPVDVGAALRGRP